MFLFSKSYALEGFGQMNLSCDKTTIIGGESINCTITGTVASTSQVSAISSRIVLSDNLELTNITTDSSWQGNGEEGIIELYTDENKSATFLIATFTAKLTEGVTNATESISLENNFFYDHQFIEHQIETTTIPIQTPQYQSTVYDLTKDYIITTTKNIETILANIETDGYTKTISGKTTGTINNTSKLMFQYNDTTVKEYTIIYIGSKQYDLTKDYIIESLADITQIENNIELMNATLNIADNRASLVYQSSPIKTYDIINITSDNYYIDIKNNYLVINSAIDNNILNNIRSTNNAIITIESNSCQIKYRDQTVKTLSIIALLSDQYLIQPGKGYVYTKTKKFDTSDIKTKNTFASSNNQMHIYSDNQLVIDLDIITIQSNTYQINADEHYIYTKNIKGLESIKDNITTTSGTLTIKNNTLEIKYQDQVVDTFHHVYFETTNVIEEDKIYIQGDLEYSTFINSLNTNGVSYKIYNTANEEVTTGTITNNYKLKIYHGDTLLDSYTIETEFLEITNLKIQEDTNIIHQVKLNTTYQALIANIKTSGTIEIEDAEGSKVELSDIAKTSDIISIHLSSKTVTYKISVLGDITGTGTVTIGDVGRLYQYKRGKIQLNEEFILAGDVTYNGKIDIGDVGRLYQFRRGRIPTLDE